MGILVAAVRGSAGGLALTVMWGLKTRVTVSFLMSRKRQVAARAVDTVKKILSR
jgi:hypothetical protein